MNFNPCSNDSDFFENNFEARYGNCVSKRHRSCSANGKENQGVYINNNPVIKIDIDGITQSVNGVTPNPERKFLSSYLEVLGNTQTVHQNRHIVFDVDSLDIAGGDITLDATGTVFTIHKPGLYQVEWNLNLAASTTSAVVGILENGEPASGSATVRGGNFASGTLIQVDTVPFTLSLFNFGNEFTVENIAPFEDSAASIRITRFADGARV